MKQKINFEEIKKRLEISSSEVNSLMLSEIIEIIYLFDNEKIEPKIKSSLSNYVVIRLISSIEHFFKNKVRELIDEQKLIPDGIFSNNEITISLEDFDQIKTEQKITKGRIISWATNFQSLDQIDFIMSKLLNIRGFRNEIGKLHHILAFAGEKEGTKFELGKLHELFELRHKIVHEMYTIEEKDHVKIRQYFALVIMFFSMTEQVIRQTLKSNYKYPEN